MSRRVLILIVLVIVLSTCALADTQYWKGQYYTDGIWNEGTYSFNFTVYDDLTNGTVCYTNTTNVTTDSVGYWESYQNGVLDSCPNSSIQYYLNINIDDADQTPRRFLKTLQLQALAQEENWTLEKNYYYNSSQIDALFLNTTETADWDQYEADDFSGVYTDLDFSGTTGLSDGTDADSIWAIVSNYLYNNSGSLDINETKLNQTIGLLDDNTLYYAAGNYIYKNGSDFFVFNETKLNATIEELDDYAPDTVWSIVSNYLYNNSGNLDINETKLNQTIQLLDTDTNTVWAIVGPYLYNQSGSLALNETKLNATVELLDDNTLYYAAGNYIYKNTSDYFWFNDTKLNATISALDNDTTYINGTGLNLTGNTFSISLGYFQDYFMELTESFGGDVSGTYDDLQLGTDVVGDAEINYTAITISDLTNDANFVANGTGASLTTLEVGTNLIYANGTSIGFLTSSVGAGYDFDFNGNVRIQGDLDVLGNLTSLSVENLNTNGSILPEQDAAFTIGNVTHRYHTIYVSDDILVNGLSVCLEDGTNCYMGTLINSSEIEDGTITNDDIAGAANIAEVKLNLSYSTGTLYDLIQAINYTHLSNFTNDLDLTNQIISHWDNITNKPANLDIDSTDDITTSNIADQNVNSSDYWDTYNNPSDIQNLLTIPCSNVSGAASDLCTLTDSDTIWVLTGDYIYNNSGSLDFNESKLNATINLLDDNTLYYAGENYIYKNGTNYFLMNETKLNATIEALDNDTTYTAGDIYVYLNGNSFTLNETKLNETINALDDYSPDTIWQIANNYIYNNSGVLTFNETKLNATIEALDDDTTYINGTGLSLTGTTFSIVLSYFQGLFVELTDSFGGDVSGTYDNLQLGANVVGDSELNYTEVTLADFTNDAGYLTTSDNDTDTNWNITNSDYVYNDSGVLKVNETKLNATIEALAVIDSDEVGDNEINYSEVTLSDFTNDLDFVNATKGAGYYYNKTATTYDGNLSAGGFLGYKAGNYLCAQSFSGTHMCSQSELILSIGYYNISSLSQWSDTAWVITGGAKYSPASLPANDCNGFTHGDSDSYLGSFWMFDQTDGGVGGIGHCANTLPIACCKPGGIE